MARAFSLLSLRPTVLVPSGTRYGEGMRDPSPSCYCANFAEHPFQALG
jgi:hypothetical protein